MSAQLFDDAEILSRYTRAQALEDGILVDMTVEPFGSMVREAGLKWPIAIPRAAVRIADNQFPSRFERGDLTTGAPEHTGLEPAASAVTV